MNPKQILNNYKLGKMPSTVYRRGGSKRMPGYGMGGSRKPVYQNQGQYSPEQMQMMQNMQTLEQQMGPDRLQLVEAANAMAQQLLSDGTFKRPKKALKYAMDVYGLTTPKARKHLLDYVQTIGNIASPIVNTAIMNRGMNQQVMPGGMPGGLVRKHGGLLKAQTTGEQILRDTLPSSFLRTSLGKDLLDVSGSTANRIRNIYEKAQGIDDISSGVDFFRSVNKKDIKNVMQEAGITRDEVRDYIYDQDFYKDASWAERQAIKVALRLKGLKHGGAQRYQTKGGVDYSGSAAVKNLIQGRDLGKKAILGMMGDLIQKTGMDEGSAAQIMGVISNMDAAEAMQYLNAINQDIEATRTEKKLLSSDMKRRGGAKRKLKYQSKGEIVPAKPMGLVRGERQQISKLGGKDTAQGRVQQMKHGGSMCRGLPGGPNEFPM